MSRIDRRTIAPDGRGEVQTAIEQGAYPDGASGYHSLRFSVG